MLVNSTYVQEELSENSTARSLRTIQKGMNEERMIYRR
jgi:hypothetical protein